MKDLTKKQKSDIENYLNYHYIHKITATSFEIGKDHSIFIDGCLHTLEALNIEYEFIKGKYQLKEKP